MPNGNGNIVEYAPGCGRRIATWHEREGQPGDVAVFGKTVYVGTLGNPPDKSGDVAVCTSTCNRVLRLPAVAELVDVYAYPGFAYKYSYSNGLGHQYNLVGITAFPMWRGRRRVDHRVLSAFEDS